MKKKRVLILGKLPPPYMGPAIATKIILESSLGNTFDLLHLNTKANESLNTMGKWSLIKIFRNLTLYFGMLRILLLKRPGLVLIPISQSTTGYVKDFIFIALARITGRKVLLQLRGSNFRNWLDSRPSWFRSMVRGSLRMCQGIIVLGHNLKPLFSGIFDENRIFVVPNGGNYDIQYSVKSNQPLRVLYLGNLQSSKGIEDVIHAASLLAEDKSLSFHLDVVGAWRSEITKEACMKLVRMNHLPVSFHPPAAGKDKFRFLSGADVFLFTPREPEGHPWVIVEAMASGLPVISTDKGAITESVRHGMNGFIVNAGDAKDIASRLAELLRDKTLREKMGKESRRLYEENFTEEKMVERLTKTFNTILAEG